jgi:putative ABC transport system permease protein
MRVLHALRTRLRLLVARRAAEARMNDEFGLHIEMETERLVRERGLDADEAKRRALVAFGGLENHKEALRSDRGLAWLTGMSLDLKLGLRMMRKYPGLTVVGVLGMAVAVAIGAVSFGIIYNLVGNSVPLDDGDRIVAIQNLSGGSDSEGRATHLHDLDVWRQELRAVEALGAYRTVDRNLITPRGRPEPVRVAEMSATGFRIARVPPLVGRYFNEDDERRGAVPVVVIGYSVWQAKFGGERDVIGRALQLGATQHTVIGVMPRGFAFPINNRVWTPLRLHPSDFERGKAPAVEVVGRLALTATIDDARTQLATIGHRMSAAYPATHEKVRPRILPYALMFIDSPELAWALHAIQLLVSMLLVVIGTNVAILVYARTASRVSEIAVRTALGASRRRIVGQLFAEALVLTASAAAIGLGGAWFALREISAFVTETGGEQIPFWMDFSVSSGMVIYVAGLAVLAAVIVGVLPALKATRRRVLVNLQQLGPGGSGMRLGRTWTVMIVAQVAVAVAILPVVLYALLVQRRVEGIVGPQIPTSEWVTASLRLDREGVGTEEAINDLGGASAARYVALRDELVRRLEADPGVADVVLASATPNAEPRMRVEVDSAGASARPDTAIAASAGHSVEVARVDRDFFRSFGVPVLVGRGFSASDASADAVAVIVNRSFVQWVLGGENAHGRRIRRAAEGREGSAERRPPGPWLEIVGVVPDFPSPESATDVRPKLYQPLLLDGASPVTLAVRVRGASPETFGNRMRELAIAVDPMLRLDAVRALDKTLSVERLSDRMVLIAVALVTVSVLLLSAAGIYALMSFTIARRRREIGIRTALGAGRSRVLRSVLRRTAGQIGTGIVVGILLAGLLVQTLEGGRADVRGVYVLLAVAAFMTVVGVLAALGPARRALRIQPTEALRTD